jgi:transcriptional regulator with XRE-family HTH domain
MTKPARRYPRLGELLIRALEERQRDGRPLTIRGAAKALGVSPATFAAWKGGERAPRARNIRQLAELLYGGDADARLVFIESLTRAVGPSGSPPVDDGSFFDRELKVGVVRYDPISVPSILGEPSKGFLDSLLRRLFNYGELRVPREFEEVDLDHAVRSLGAGEFDIIAGMMATVDRAKLIHFIPTPITLPVNAVLLKDHLEQLSMNGDKAKESLRRAITDPAGEETEGFRIHPIFRTNEIGGLYCRLALGLSEKDTERVTIADRYDKNVYHDLLAGHRIVNSENFPLVVADELMCIQVLQLAAGKADLLFDLEKSFEELPCYSIGFAVPRSKTTLISYLEEVFPIYLRADIHFLIDRYGRLYKRLLTHVSKALQSPFTTQTEQNWASKVLRDSAKDQGVFPPGWAKIVEALPKRNAT